MKKLLLNIISLILLASSCYSQDAVVAADKDHGFIDISSLGIMLPSGNNSYYTFTANFQTCNGYKFNNYFAILGGVGADLYGDNIMLPIFINPSITFLKGPVSPILEPEFGYSFSLAPKFWGVNGAYFNVSPGIKVKVAPGCNFIFCIAYERQYFSTPYVTQILNDNNQTYPTVVFNSLSFVNVRIGLEF